MIGRGWTVWAHVVAGDEVGVPGNSWRVLGRLPDGRAGVQPPGGGPVLLVTTRPSDRVWRETATAESLAIGVLEATGIQTEVISSG